MDALVNYLDSFRVYLLRFTLKPGLFRHLYGRAHLRLGAGMILSTAFYLPLALTKPALLLAFGPLIFGYPHLVSSYRYVQEKSYRLFILMTVVAIILHLTRVGFFQYEQLPFGVWQIVVAAFTLIISRILSKRTNVLEISACILLSAGLIRFAWMEPLIFVGGTLILHNWIAFVYWIIAAKENKRRAVAIFSSVLFLIIHILVLNGHFDSWIPFKDGEVLFESGSHITGWYLASWTVDKLVWYRFLVLYTFGLSIHYFVWLKAIPESLNKFEHPNRFSFNFKTLRQDLGTKTLIVSILVIAVGWTLWLFNLPLGSAIYFEIAILHGAIEEMFLIPKLLRLKQFRSLKSMYWT